LYTNGKTVRIFRGSLAVAAALSAAGVLTACGAGTTGSPSAAGTPAPSSSVSSPAAPAAPAAQSTGTDDSQASNVSTSQGPKYCKAADLSLAITEGNGAGMSHDNVNLRFTNKSKQSCDLQGSPGVSFVAGTDGHQVGAPATRQPKSQGKLHVLAPGTSVQSSLTFTNPGALPSDKCTMVDVLGLRVYAPDDTASMFLPLPQQACSNPGTSLMTVNVVA
jgi:hypothetical protein